MNTDSTVNTLYSIVLFCSVHIPHSIRCPISCSAKEGRSRLPCFYFDWHHSSVFWRCLRNFQWRTNRNGCYLGRLQLRVGNGTLSFLLMPITNIYIHIHIVLVLHIHIHIHIHKHMRGFQWESTTAGDGFPPLRWQEKQEQLHISLAPFTACGPLPPQRTLQTATATAAAAAATAQIKPHPTSVQVCWIAAWMPSLPRRVLHRRNSWRQPFRRFATPRQVTIQNSVVLLFEPIGPLCIQRNSKK